MTGFAKLSPDSEATIDSQLIEAASEYAQTLTRLLGSMFSAELTAGETKLDELGQFSNYEIMISLMFTGSFYGEFVLSMSLSQAQAILGIFSPSEQNAKEQCAEVLSEILNMASGECFSKLVQENMKLTLTAPKVVFGRVKFPRIKAGKTVLSYRGQEAIECLLYLDRMKLDIDSSYRSTLGELKILNRDLLEALEKLQAQQQHLIQSEKMVALGTMAAGVAHEINTPLSTIILAEEQMKESISEGQVDAKALFKMLSVIEKTTHKISRITKTLRFYASDNRGEAVELKKLDYIVHEAALPLKEAMLKKNIRIIIDGSLSSVEVECRPVQLAQVFYDLMQNSIYAISDFTNKWILIKCSEHGGEVSISVVDSGEGIAEAVQGRIFDPFFTTKKFGDGIGLGLSQARGILNGHGGQIHLKPRSRNTEFVLTLPIKRTQKAA